MKKNGKKIKADELHKFKELVKSLPEGRKEAIEAMKRKIESGEYTLDPEITVQKMIDLFYELENMKPKKPVK